MSAFTPIIEEAVTKGLETAGLEETPEHRVQVMKNVYRDLTAKPIDNPMEKILMKELLRELETMIVDLEATL